MCAGVSPVRAVRTEPSGKRCRTHGSGTGWPERTRATGARGNGRARRNAVPPPSRSGGRDTESTSPVSRRPCTVTRSPACVVFLGANDLRSGGSRSRRLARVYAVVRAAPRSAGVAVRFGRPRPGRPQPPRGTGPDRWRRHDPDRPPPPPSRRQCAPGTPSDDCR